MPYKTASDKRRYHARYFKRWYEKNKRKQIANTLKNKRKRRALIEERIAPLKRKPCTDCRRRFPPVAMDFDHVRGRKKKDVAAMIHAALPLKVVLAEIAKCELVCACCHRIRTHARAQF